MNTNILKGIWGTQSGYVFVPRRKKTAEDTRWDEGRAFRYPDDWKAIETRVTKSSKEGWDVYWCPLVFDKPKRIKENVKAQQSILWADLDEVNPTELGGLRPSIAWASSDDRYQSLWVLDSRADIGKIEEVNKELTYHIGADKGGWDVTQVLRVPGSSNYKYDPPQKGRLLWVEKRYFVLDKIKDIVHDDTPDTKDTGDTIDDLLEGWDVPKRIVDLIKIDEDKVEVGKRSDKLWEIETSLLESGIPILTVVDIISKCAWNKFKDRRNEMEQIYNEVLKADEHIKRKVVSTRLSKTTDKDTSNWAIPFGKFLSTKMEEPSWLVEGIWQKGTYGMIAGEPKTYKSVQATDLALSVASGKHFLNYFPVNSRGAVLYVQEENNAQTVQDRVFKIAASKGLLTSTPHGLSLPVDLPLHFSNNYGINLTTEESRELLENTIKEINPVLVILDPLYMMLGGVDENSAKEVGDVLRWLTYIRNQYNTAILICHHYNKGGTSSSNRGGQRVRGSSAFHAWVESALYIKATDELYTVKIDREFRAFPSMPELKLKIELGNPGDLYYSPIIENSKETPIEEDSIEIKSEEILTVLSGAPRDFEELKTLVGITKRKLQTIIKSLEKDGYIEVEKGGGRGHKTTYKLCDKRSEYISDEAI